MAQRRSLFIMYSTYVDAFEIRINWMINMFQSINNGLIEVWRILFRCLVLIVKIVKDWPIMFGHVNSLSTTFIFAKNSAQRNTKCIVWNNVRLANCTRSSRQMGQGQGQGEEDWGWSRWILNCRCLLKRRRNRCWKGCMRWLKVEEGTRVWLRECEQLYRGLWQSRDKVTTK